MIIRQKKGHLTELTLRIRSKAHCLWVFRGMNSIMMMKKKSFSAMTTLRRLLEIEAILSNKELIEAKGSIQIPILNSLERFIPK